MYSGHHSPVSIAPSSGKLPVYHPLFFSSVRSVVATFRGAINLMISGISVMSFHQTDHSFPPISSLTAG